jgi:hypothetical protein
MVKIFSYKNIYYSTLKRKYKGIDNLLNTV